MDGRSTSPGQFYGRGIEAARGVSARAPRVLISVQGRDQTRCKKPHLLVPSKNTVSIIMNVSFSRLPALCLCREPTRRRAISHTSSLCVLYAGAHWPPRCIAVHVVPRAFHRVLEFFRRNRLFLRWKLYRRCGSSALGQKIFKRLPIRCLVKYIVLKLFKREPAHDQETR